MNIYLSNSCSFMNQFIKNWAKLSADNSTSYLKLSKDGYWNALFAVFEILIDQMSILKRFKRRVHQSTWKAPNTTGDYTFDAYSHEDKFRLPKFEILVFSVRLMWKMLRIHESWMGFRFNAWSGSIASSLVLYVATSEWPVGYRMHKTILEFRIWASRTSVRKA